MNWQAVSFDWNQVRAFLATAEEGSFSGAARALKTSQPTIGRQISALEGALGVTLVVRSTRGLGITQAGLDLLDHVRAMGEAATLISMAAEGQSQDITGEVTVTATDLMSALILPKMLSPLRQKAPGLRVRLKSANQIDNLSRREADIAIRHVRPDQSDLIVRHVGDFRGNFYASRTYLDKEGRPLTLRELADHDFVGNPDQERLIGPLNDRGVPLSEASFVISSESGVITWELVKSGYGISMLPEVLCEAEPDVERVLPTFASMEFPIWLATHRELKTNRRIRLVFDMLARSLSEVARSQ